MVAIKQTVPSKPLTLDDYRRAAELAGVPIYYPKQGRFSLHHSACCGSASPGHERDHVWVQETKGWAAAFCHSCRFPDSDRQVRESLGLPEWSPPRASSDSDRQPHATERWEYRSTDGSKSAVQMVQRHQFDCYRTDCEVTEPYKHSWI